MSAFGSTRALGGALTREESGENCAANYFAAPSVASSRHFRLPVEGSIAFPGRSGRPHGLEIEQSPVHKVRGHEIRERAKHRVHAPRMAFLPLGEHALHLLSLQRRLRTAQVAGNDGEAPDLRVRLEVGL